jgi:hypothetical protein
LHFDANFSYSSNGVVELVVLEGKINEQQDELTKYNRARIPVNLKWLSKI